MKKLVERKQFLMEQKDIRLHQRELNEQIPIVLVLLVLRKDYQKTNKMIQTHQTIYQERNGAALETSL